MYLDALDPDLASEGGSNLSSVLAQGGQLLGATSDPADRVLVVFTDGEAHDTLPGIVAQAAALKEAGVHLIMVSEGAACARQDSGAGLGRKPAGVQAGRGAAT